VNDNSAGNDGFVAKKQFRSIKSLKGKTVATELGTVDHFLLLQALAKNGMTEKDIVFKNHHGARRRGRLSPGQTRCRRLVATVAERCVKEGKANLLFTSKDVPG
jgi:NitT/TauT family transport system substrate-binding protein